MMVSESWLAMDDDPEKWACAMMKCESLSGYCGQDGYCHRGDCFTKPPSISTKLRRAARSCGDEKTKDLLITAAELLSDT